MGLRVAGIALVVSAALRSELGVYGLDTCLTEFLVTGAYDWFLDLLEFQNTSELGPLRFG